MAWRQKDFDEVTVAIEKNRQEYSTTRMRQSNGDFTHVKSLGLKKLLIKLYEKARTTPESLPQPPWERNVDGLLICNCGKCDGRGRVFDEIKGVKFCEESQIRGRSHLAEADFDLGSIFDE